MVPGSLSDGQRRQLLRVARASIEEGLNTGRPLQVDVNSFDPLLQADGASFVTLKKSGQLRGCMGTLEARQPLVQDVAEHAFAAAFSDPRFPPLERHELEQISISVSVLTPAEPVRFRDEDDLLEKITPGVDGLILQEGPYRGTFLPSVWESLPDKKAFLRELKRKAGLPPDYWSDRIRVSRYKTIEFSEQEFSPDIA